MKKKDSRTPKSVDMSSEAMDRRLRELGQLYELGVEIQGARWLGTLQEIAEREASRHRDVADPSSDFPET